MKPTNVTAFGGRLIEAFKGIGIDNLTGIARKLGVQNSAITNYIQGRIPPSELLIKISDFTNCSIHWLVKGEGAKSVDDAELRSLVAEEHQSFISDEAAALNKDPADFCNALISMGSFAWTTQKAHGIDALKVLEQLASSHGPSVMFRGEDLEEGEVAIYFGAKEHEIIQKLAAKSNREFEDEVRELILENLKGRGLIRDRIETSDIIFFGDRVPKTVTMMLHGEIAAGAPLDIFPNPEPIQVPRDFERRGKQTFVLRVRGDSMIDDGIRDGDLIVCEAAKTATRGETVVAVIDGEKATVKNYFPERGRIRLQPANELHEPIFVTDDRLDIQGIVIGLYRKPQR